MNLLKAFIALTVSCTLLIQVTFLKAADNILTYKDQTLQLTATFANNFAKSHQLNHYHTGSCTPGMAHSCCSFGLMGNQQMNLSELKILTHECVKTYIAFISAQPATNQFYFQKKEWQKSLPLGFQPDYVGIRIGFWTKDMNRQMPPYIAEMRFFNKTYHYYQADPETQKLILVNEEPYDEQIQKTEPK